MDSKDTGKALVKTGVSIMSLGCLITLTPLIVLFLVFAFMVLVSLF
jgi:hypothetical protein